MVQSTTLFHSIRSNGSLATPPILVMDNDPNMRLIYEKALCHAGYQVYQAATLQQSRHLLASNHFDLFICDICMGGNHSGADLLAEQCAALRQAGTQVIAVTCGIQYGLIGEKLAAEHMRKPVTIHRLVTLVNRLMGLNMP